MCSDPVYGQICGQKDTPRASIIDALGVSFCICDVQNLIRSKQRKGREQNKAQSF